LRQAQAYLTKKLHERDLGRGVEGVQVTLNEYLDRWLGTAAKPRLREKSYRDYEGMLRRYIRPTMGEKILTTVSPLDIQGVYQQIIERGFSARSIRYTHAVVRSALRQAVRWQLLLNDPTEGVQLPRQPRREMRVLTTEQARTFLKVALTTPYGCVFALALTTGMRPSEYLALKWEDIDWERGMVSVVRTLEKGSGCWRFAETKRARSRRVVKLQNWVLNLLKDLRSARAQGATSDIPPDAVDLVFATASGQPINEDYLVKKRFKPILRQAGLSDIRLYDLRHTAATLALTVGVPPKVVSEQLGHASAAFTLDTYSHVLPHMQEEAAAKMEAALLHGLSF
jgi:integrase